LADGEANSPFVNKNIEVDIDKLKKLVDTSLNEYDQIRIGFFGGEPLANFDYIKEVIDTFKNYDEDKFSFFFYTNGLLLPRYLDDFKKWNEEFGKERGKDGRPRLHLQISYDGEYQTDKLRVDALGIGTAKRVKAAYRAAKEAGLDVSLKATIVAESFPYLYDTFIEFIEELDNGYYAPTPDTHSSRSREQHNEDMKILYSELKKIAKYIFKNNLRPEIFSWFSERKALCSVGNQLNMIDINGDVTVCHGASFMDDRDIHILGNVDNFEEVKENMAKMDYVLDYSQMSEECQNCDVLYCMKCNIVNEYKSDKETYKERMMDFPANFQLCETFKTNDRVHKTLRYALNHKDELSKSNEKDVK
jgi:uncharacterized protein